MNIYVLLRRIDGLMRIRGEHLNLFRAFCDVVIYAMLRKLCDSVWMSDGLRVHGRMLVFILRVVIQRDMSLGPCIG